jgi:Tfp pilus assembly protein PilX
MHPAKNRSLHSQSGAITMLVALMLLVLLTIAAVGMSRNAFREVVISGTTRQGTMVRNAADAGVEWSIYWIDLKNASAGSGTALALKSLSASLLLDDTKSGKPYNVVGGSAFTGPPSVSGLQADQTMTTGSNILGFSTSLTRMGKLPITDTSQGNVQGSFTPATGNPSKQAPDLWAIRSDAQLQVGTGTFAPTFIHAKEAWVSTPVQ